MKTKTVKQKIAKAFTWKLLSTSLAVFIGYVLTGSVNVALGIAILHIPASMVIFVAHESLWDRHLTKLEEKNLE